MQKVIFNIQDLHKILYRNQKVTNQDRQIE